MENISLSLIMIMTFDSIFNFEFSILNGNYTTKQQDIMSL